MVRTGLDSEGAVKLHTTVGSGGAGTDVNLTGINGVTPSVGAGASDTGTLRVIVSTDSPSTGNSAASATGAAVPANADYGGVNVGGTLRGATGVNPSGSIFAQQIDLASIAGTTASVNNGTVDAGTLRVTVASNSTGTTIATQGTATNLKTQAENYQGGTAVGAANPLQVSLANTGANGTAVKVDGTGGTFPVSGTVAVTQSTNPWLVAGTGTAGTANAGVVTVQGIASMTPVQVSQATGSNLHTVVDSGTITTVSTVTAVTDAQVQGKAASGAAKSGNPVQVGGVFNTTQPTVTNGQAVENQSTARGAQIVATGVDAFSVTAAAGTALIGKVSASLETSTIYSGTTALTPKFAAISASSNGNNTVVSAGTNKIRVLAWNLMASGTVNVKWQSGAGGTDLTGLYYLIANTGISVPFSPVGYFETTSATLLNLNLSGAIPVGGNIVYIDVA